MPKKTDIVCYAEKEEKPFWFKSLGQLIQFGAIKIWRTSRTFVVSSCGLKKSHYNSRGSLEAPTKNDAAVSRHSSDVITIHTPQ